MAGVTASWSPLTLAQTQSLFDNFCGYWWVAGGWAIELAAGEYIREHRDTDVVILRREQGALRDLLRNWDVAVADPPGAGRLRVWLPNETLELPIHGLWCRRTADGPWSLEILLDEGDGDDWVSRREARVRRPLASLGWRTAAGLPVLAPEVVLFYKAKNVRPEDDCDFDAVLPRLTSTQRAWLDETLAISFPAHPWRLRLARCHPP